MAKCPIEQQNVELLYTPYEPDGPHPERLKLWLARQDGIGKLESEIKLGPITIQKGQEYYGNNNNYLGLILRLYDYTARFAYGHDADLVGWVIKDIIVDKHPRLIGQLTSSPGIFIGALYYYLQIPFYWLSNMDPIGVYWLTALTGILSIASMWFVAGPIASFIYASSWLIANTERDVFPTTPVFLWSIWFSYFY